MMNKTSMTIVLVGLVLIALFTSWMVDSQLGKLDTSTTSRGGMSHSAEQTPAPAVKVSGKQMVKEGVVGCLTLKKTSGPQMDSCALGLRQDDGTTYGLRDDTNMLMGVATGQRIRIVGTLAPATNTRYVSSGTLVIQSLQKR